MFPKIRIAFAVLLTGILGILIYPTVIGGHRLPDCGFLAWIYLVPLFLVLKDQQKGKMVFRISYLASLISYLGGLYWLIPAMNNFGDLSLVAAVLVLLLLCLVLSFFYSLAFLLSFHVSRLTRFSFFLAAPFFLAAFDFARHALPFNGFPWPAPAYSQGAYLDYFQWVDITGVHGLNFLVFLVNGCMAEILRGLQRDEKDGAVNRVFVLVILIVASLYFSVYQQRKLEKPTGDGKNYQLALIQGNIAQNIKWDPYRARENLNRYVLLTKRATDNGADIAIWPETSFPYNMDVAYLEDGLPLPEGELPIPTLVGAVTEENNGDDQPPVYYNSVYAVATDLKFTGIYHKRHLVPFGEYVPLKRLFRFARRLTSAVGDFTPGRQAALISLDGLRVGNLICYEDIFPDLARSATKKGANLLANYTNDAWYGNTSAQYQHLVFSQMRALENRRYLVRATNTGMTAVIDPRGKVLHALPPFTEDVLIKSVPTETRLSFYTLWGDWVAWICVVACLGFVVYGYGKEKLCRKNFAIS